MRVICAIAVSLFLHALLAVGIVAYLEYAPAPKTLATLDVSSVELSFSDIESDAVVAAASAMESVEAPPPVPEISDAPETPDTPETPDRPDFPKPPRPPEVRERLETPLRQLAPPMQEVAAAAAEPAPAPRQAKIDAPPRPTHSIKPDYPKGARQRGEQGDVVLLLSINKSGGVDSVSVIGSCGFPELDDAAVVAAKKARFTPARSGDSAVPSKARLTLTFTLR